MTKTNFDKKDFKIQGADGNRGFGGNVNPANQDMDKDADSDVSKKYKATSHNPNMDFDGGVGHDYTSSNN